MTAQEKQSELQRYKDILLATLDYLIEQLPTNDNYDELSHVEEYYRQQKLQIEKYYTQRRLDRLQQRLASLTKGLQNSTHLNFANYIKEKTSYNIDIFESLKKRIEIIIKQKEIRSKKEFNDVSVMYFFYQDTATEPDKAEILKSLVIDYSNKKKRNN